MKTLKKFDIRQAFGLLILAIVLAIVANALFMVFVVRPIQQEYAALQQDSATELKNVRNRARIVESKEAFLLAVSQAETDLETLRSEKLSTRKQRMVNVGYELHRLAEEHRVNMDRVVYQNEKLPEEQLDRYGMVVPLEGGYSNLRQFISNVERSSEWLVIEQIQIGQGQQNAAALLMNITLATYFDDSGKPPAQAEPETSEQASSEAPPNSASLDQAADEKLSAIPSRLSSHGRNG